MPTVLLLMVQDNATKRNSSAKQNWHHDNSGLQMKNIYSYAPKIFQNNPLNAA